MKKMMMTLAIVLFAVAANAGSITWTSSGLKTALPNGTFSTTALSGAVAYLFLGTPDATAIANSIANDTFTGSGNLASAFTATTGAITKMGVGSYVSTPVTVYMVIFDASTIANANYFMISSAITQTFGASGNKTYTFVSSNGTLPSSWTAVPEPTSMALLALGVAAIGLRRRFMK